MYLAELITAGFLCFFVVPWFSQSSCKTAFPNDCLHHFTIVTIKYGMGKPPNVELHKEAQIINVSKQKNNNILWRMWQDLVYLHYTSCCVNILLLIGVSGLWPVRVDSDRDFSILSTPIFVIVKVPCFSMSFDKVMSNNVGKSTGTETNTWKHNLG